MENKSNRYKAIFSILIVAGLLHGAIHLALYGTGITGFYQTGLSGFAISEAGENIVAKSQPIQPVSKLFLFGEWILAGGSFVFFTLRKRTEIRSQISSIKLAPYYAASKSRTDIDVLYALLNDKQKLGLSVISEVFKVPKTTVVEWARILQSGSLINISYPAFGEPTLEVRK